jgi:hypothetical protein
MFLDSPGGVNSSNVEIWANHKGTKDTKKSLDSLTVSPDTGGVSEKLNSRVMGARR